MAGLGLVQHFCFLFFDQSEWTTGALKNSSMVTSGDIAVRKYQRQYRNQSRTQDLRIDHSRDGRDTLISSSWKVYLPLVATVVATEVVVYPHPSTKPSSTNKARSVRSPT